MTLAFSLVNKNMHYHSCLHLALISDSVHSFFTAFFATVKSPQ